MIINRLRLAWCELRLRAAWRPGSSTPGLTGVDVLEWKAACHRGAESARLMRHDPIYLARKAEALNRWR